MPLELRPAEPAALICAVLAAGPQNLDRAVAELDARFGAVSRWSAVYPFDFSSYYAREMGPRLLKQIVCFTRRVDPAELAAVKGRTMELERALADAAHDPPRRTANVDPGLVTVDSLVLATTKYSGQRICIAPGLYAEVTLLFQHGGWSPFPWTYPDYRTSLVQDFLLGIRTDLLRERRERAARQSTRMEASRSGPTEIRDTGARLNSEIRST